MNKTTRYAVLFLLRALVLCAIGTASVSLQDSVVHAQDSAAGTAEIRGRVLANRGTVRAFRVKAKDTVRKITYTVFTKDGQYAIHRLSPSNYQVQVLEEGFASPVESVELKSGVTTTVDIALKAKGGASIAGAGARANVANQSYGAGAIEEGSSVKLVEFDELYPPGHTRDLMVKTCFGCHGITGWHQLGEKTDAQWRAAVGHMFKPYGLMGVEHPILSRDAVSPEQEESIVKYLAANFGPGAVSRDLKTDPLLRDEAALAGVLYVQYELPPLPVMPWKGARMTHDVFPSSDPSRKGVVYVAGIASGSILSVDTRNPDPATRAHEWLIENPGHINVAPHGVIEQNGMVFWTELAGSHLGQLDPQTGAMSRTPALTPGGGVHTLAADSLGNIWYTQIAANKIGRMNIKTKKITEWEPIQNADFYAVVIDPRNRAWVSGVGTATIVMYDPKTENWTKFPTTYPARRMSVDSKGKIWFCEYFGNAIGVIDPATRKVTEYKLPLRNGNPYEIWADHQDNLWIDNAVYDAMVKFEPRSKKFTYIPFPDFGAHTPKVALDSEGTIWLSGSGTALLTALKPAGNVAAIKASPKP